jgi:hypothetical protein
MNNMLVDVTCPSCFESFEIVPPPVEEVPTEWDYDCEVCCRPMIIAFYEEANEVWAEARGLND